MELLMSHLIVRSFHLFVVQGHNVVAAICQLFSQIASDTLERMTGIVDFSPSPRFPSLPTYHILHKQTLHDLLMINSRGQAWSC